MQNSLYCRDFAVSDRRASDLFGSSLTLLKRDKNRYTLSRASLRTKSATCKMCCTAAISERLSVLGFALGLQNFRRAFVDIGTTHFDQIFDLVFEEMIGPGDDLVAQRNATLHLGFDAHFGD